METDRLLLLRFSGEDAEALLAFLGDPEVNEFLPMFPLRDAAEAERYLRYIGDWVRRRWLRRVRRLWRLVPQHPQRTAQGP